MTAPITFRTLTIDGGVILGGKPVTTLRAVDGYAMTWDPGTPWVKVHWPAGAHVVLVPVARCHGEEEPTFGKLGEPPGWLGACNVCTGSVTTHDEPRMMEGGEIRHAEAAAADEPAARALEAALRHDWSGVPVTKPLRREPESDGVPATPAGRKGGKPKR